MNDYEGQAYEDIEAQAEAYYASEDQWFKNMEYLEAYDDAHLNEIEAEEINRILDNIEADRNARENGEKPANEWVRTDFKDLLRPNPKLRHLSTRELRAFFLRCEDYIDGIKYYERVSGGNLCDTDLAVPPIVRRQMYENHYALQRWFFEDTKLWRIWRNLVKNRREK